MIHTIRLGWVGSLLAGCILGPLCGCGSSEPVMNDDARALQVQEVKAQTEANDAAAKEAKKPRPAAGLMPP